MGKRFQVASASMMSLMLLLSACSAADKQGAAPKGQDQPANKSEAVENGKLKEPVTIKFVNATNPTDKSLPAGDTLDNNQFTRYLKEKVNVDFKLAWTAASGDPYNQKLKLSIASNDIPDVLIVGEKDFRTLVDADMVQDLTEAYNKYASPLLRELYGSTSNKALENAKLNGKMMAIPNIVPQADSVNLLWVRKDWLDKLGLKEPKTIDDIMTIAKAFIEKDPDGNGKADTVGFPASDVSGSFSAVFNSYNAFPGMWLNDSSGKVFYGSTTPETKQALGKIHEMYAAGLIDKEFALRKDSSELVVSGKSGMFFGPWWSPWGSLRDAVKNDPKADWIPYLAPVDSKGDYVSRFYPISTSYLVVKKEFKHPEAVVLAMNATIAAERGTDPDASKLDPKVFPGYWPMRLTIDYLDAVERKHDMLQGALDGTVKPEQLTSEMKPVYDAAMKEQKKPSATVDQWGPYYSYLLGGKDLRKPMKKVYSIFNTETPTMEKKWVNLKKLEDETFLKIVMGDAPLDAFDKFVEAWKAQGGNEIIQEVTKATQK